MPLKLEERQRLLAEPHVAALPVVAELDRAPLSVPIWYGYEPGGELWVQTPAASRKAELIRPDGGTLNDAGAPGGPACPVRLGRGPR